MRSPTRATLPEDRAFIETLIRYALAIVLLGQASAAVTDTDIWGHMAFGFDMLHNRQLMWVDPYSFTSDQPWVNHEWLWDVCLAAISQVGGLPAIVALRTLLVGAVLWAVDRTTRGVPSWLRLVTLAAVVVACAPQWRSTRPQMMTLTLVAIVLQNLEAWWLPPVFALWANLHGGWLFGMAAVATHAATTRTPRALAVAALCAGATLVTPYGFHLWLALADAVTRGWTGISEWEPVWRVAAGVDALVLWSALVVGVLLLWRRTSHRDYGAWGFSLAAIAAAANSRRLIALAAVACAVLLVPLWNGARAQIRIVWTRPRRWMLAAVAALAALTAVPTIRPTLVCFPPTPGWAAPESDAVAFLRGADVTRIVPYFDFGEYAIFHLRDRMRMAIDNRRETVYSAAVVEANARFADGLDPEYPDRIGADAVWWPADGARVLDGLAARGWVRRFEGPRTVVMMKTAGPIVRGAEVAGTPCFPHP